MENTQNILHDQDDEKNQEETTAYHSNIDNSRPFRSVKEAVAIFGERLLTLGSGGGGGREINSNYSPNNKTPAVYSSRYNTPSQSPLKEPLLLLEKTTSSSSSANKSPPFNNNDEERQPTVLMESLKKLEAELEETKMELKLLKERESETEVALASLNAELHKNMSKLAQAEAAAANSKATMLLTSNSRSNSSSTSLAQFLNSAEDRKISSNKKQEEEEKKKKVGMKMTMMMTKTTKVKKKPIIPLVGDLFSRKKGNSSTTMLNPLFASPSSHYF